MKSQNLIIAFGLILVFFLTSNCGISGKMATATKPVARITANTMRPSTSPQIVSSSIPTIGITPTATSSKETTPILVPSAIVSVIPTLAVDDAHAKLTDLLANNGGCQLPCLWGITPGAATVQQVRDILASLSILSDFILFESESGATNINAGLKDDQLLNIAISYLANEDNVYGIKFEGRDMQKLADQQSGGYAFQDVFDSPYFGEKLDFYMLHMVLAAHDQPISVLLTTWSEIPSPRYGQGNFKLILLYPEQGIAVQYTTEMRVDGNNIVGCLDNAHVEMYLFPKGNSENFYQQLALTDWQNRIEYYKPLEDVTSLSIDEFYETFQKSTDKCLITPANLWPIPEN